MNNSLKEYALDNIWDTYLIPIQYGICRSEEKFSEPSPLHFADTQIETVKSMMTDVGLPFRVDDFLGAKNQDLLFLEQHGIVVKISHLNDPIDLIHPCLVQPLGWITDETTDLTLSIFAGEKLSDSFSDEDMEHFVDVLHASGQEDDGEIFTENLGLAEIPVNSGVLQLPILIDVEPEEAITVSEGLAEKKQSLYSTLWGRNDVNNAQSHREILNEVYKDVKAVGPWMSQFDRHQPLRELFWKSMDAQPEGRAVYLKGFWDTVAQWTEKPAFNGVQLHRDYLRPL